MRKRKIRLSKKTIRALGMIVAFAIATSIMKDLENNRKKTKRGAKK